MSKVNFLKHDYRIEDAQNTVKCGIVDGEDASPAYTTSRRDVKWNATICNPQARMFQFVPVDNNIIYYRDNGEKESSCDGMLLVEENDMIAFIELKDVQRGGYADAIEQLRTTISYFVQNHQYDIFRLRRAYAANIAHPNFHYNMKDQMESFRKLRFILYPEATINF